MMTILLTPEKPGASPRQIDTTVYKIYKTVAEATTIFIAYTLSQQLRERAL